MDRQHAVSRTALCHWQLFERNAHGPLSHDELIGLRTRSGSYGSEVLLPVHEILEALGVIDSPARRGGQEPCLWVAQRDWLYRCQFPHRANGALRLLCAGLDTIVDVWLNGCLVHAHRNCYVPMELELTALQVENELILHVHAPEPWREGDAWCQQQLTAGVNRHRLLRKPAEDFNFFNGPKPSFTPMGPYAPMVVECMPHAALEQVQVDARPAADGSGTVALRATLRGRASAVRWRIHDPDGEVLHEQTQTADPQSVQVHLSRIRLWWPNGYGDHPMYRIECEVLADDQTVLDSAQRHVGFRDVEMNETLDCRVNGVPVHLWGANLTPLPGGSHRVDSSALRQLLDLAVTMNCTSLRAWGPGQPWPDELYQLADERGLLIWAEFAHTGGPWPDDDEFRAKCIAEAEHWIKRWRHHPSLLCWCGGNESYLGLDIDKPGVEIGNIRLFEEGYRDAVNRLDPLRCYVPNSPHGGTFGNCTRHGDTHLRTYEFWQPGDQFPNLVGETIRVTIPLRKTLERHLGSDLQWPTEFSGIRRRFEDPVVPESWIQALAPNQDWVRNRIGCMDELFDHANDPDALLDRLGQGTALYIRRSVERYRRGRDTEHGPRRCKGHYWWKFNDTFPMLYASLVDDLLEPNMAYYAMRRAYRPLLTSIEYGDQIRLWVVNDSATPVIGTLRLQRRDMRGDTIYRELQFPVQAAPGESVLVGDGDAFGMFYRRDLLVAILEDAQGRELDHCCEWLCPERHRWIAGEPTVTLRQDGDEVVLSATAMAARVQLTGRDPGGDEFGWYFSDNFIDVIPDREYRVEILGRHDQGCICATSPWSQHRTSLSWQRRRPERVESATRSFQR
jgi:beta-mannosidase